MPKTGSNALGRRKNKRWLVEASPERAFWTSSGMVLQNLRSLAEAFVKSMSDEEYAYHAHGEHNDFAKWVEEVLEDAACAKALRRAKNRTAAGKAVAAALKKYER